MFNGYHKEEFVPDSSECMCSLFLKQTGFMGRFQKKNTLVNHANDDVDFPLVYTCTVYI